MKSHNRIEDVIFHILPEKSQIKHTLIIFYLCHPGFLIKVEPNLEASYKKNVNGGGWHLYQLIDFEFSHDERM